MDIVRGLSFSETKDLVITTTLRILSEARCAEAGALLSVQMNIEL